MSFGTGHLHKRIFDLEKKLEAVKKWYKYEADKKGDNPWWYNKRLRELSKILEVDK